MAGPGPLEDTVNVALLDRTEPAKFETVTEKVAPLSEVVSAGVVYDVPVAPVMSELFFRHWYASGAVPVAVTENVAVAPVFTVWLAGWVVIAGRVAAGVVGVAGALDFPLSPPPQAENAKETTIAHPAMTALLKIEERDIVVIARGSFECMVRDWKAVKCSGVMSGQLRPTRKKRTCAAGASCFLI